MRISSGHGKTLGGLRELDFQAGSPGAAIAIAADLTQGRFEFNNFASPLNIRCDGQVRTFLSMHQFTVSIETSDPTAASQRIIAGVIDYNDAQALPENYRELIVVARDDRGEMIGGLRGYTHWTWLGITHLWIAEGFRQRGVGSRLMAAAESEACARGCLHSHCDTFEFQALPFYLKHGYIIFGRLEDYPKGHARYFLEKRNLRAGEV